ncbi:E3 ubiquitin-protein ligase makorin-1-like [Fukomys damarensis]|uniref:E3 ubiquitin-protein ligase makorin-1-like n=1 Tax=Fukomys damarensis TaxID=885580 RepID=UPI00054013E4|nr:E3 ubiquitin-protein ligase makorin-1-like [Fukomys damarensis]
MAALLVHQHCSNAFDQNGKAASTGTDQGVTPVLQQPLICPAPGRFSSALPGGWHKGAPGGRPLSPVAAAGMHPAGAEGSSHGAESSLHSRRPRREVPRVCKYFQRGLCFHGDRCSYQHLVPASPLEWGRRYSEPLVAVPGQWPGLTRRASEPTFPHPIVVEWGQAWLGAHWGMELGLEEAGGSSWRSPSSSPAAWEHSPAEKPPLAADLVQELSGALQSLDLAEGSHDSDSRDVVCGICRERVWDKPACRVYSSYIIPHKFWVSDGPEKEQLIRTFTARTRQIQCRFFMRGNGRCPFRSNCIYLHQLPAQALASSPPWAPGSEVLGSLLFPGATRPGEHVSFSGHVLAPAPWDSEFLLDHGNS